MLLRLFTILFGHDYRFGSSGSPRCGLGRSIAPLYRFARHHSLTDEDGQTLVERGELNAGTAAHHAQVGQQETDRIEQKTG